MHATLLKRLCAVVTVFVILALPLLLIANGNTGSVASAKASEATTSSSSDDNETGSSKRMTTAELKELMKEPLASWTTDSDCAQCHDDETLSLESSACVNAIIDGETPSSSALSDSSTQSTSKTCLSCHQDADALAEVHHDASGKKGKTPKRLKETEVDPELCLSCHGGSIEELVKMYPDIVVTDSEGTSVNPHAILAEPSHADCGVTCVDCHNPHDTETDIQDQAVLACATCHHASVFSCYTCHD